MNATKKLLLLTALVAPSAAFANEGAHIDAYYIPSAQLDVEDPVDGDFDDDGDGFGAKAMLPLGVTQSFFLNGEYQTSKYDKNDLDLDQFRIGAGWQTPLATGTLGIYGEYDNLSFDSSGGDEADGLGVHARVAFPVAPAVQLYGQVGYLSLEYDNNIDLTGVEFLVGASVDFTPSIGAFIDYRQSNLTADESGPNIDYTLQDLRVGIRILF